MIDSTPPVVELTTTRSKMVLTSEKSVFLAPGTLVTVHTVRKKKDTQENKVTVSQNERGECGLPRLFYTYV